MRVPLRWLREFVDIPMPAEDIAHRLTMAGTEVGSIDRIGDEWTKVIIGRALEVDRHPGADHLFVARVDIGGETITLVTAAPNLRAGYVVPVIRPGGKLGPDRPIEARKFRGILSEGMLCSGAELGVSSDDEHIYVLEPEAPVGVELASYLGDEVLDVELTPNRPDCLGVLGIAREISALTGAPLRLPPATNGTDRSANGSSPLKVFVDDPDLCPRYTGRYFENVRIAESPPWLQRRLHLAGVRPISNVVDITNYVMLELGQPLHAFDADRLTDMTIRVRRARTGERITTIDGTQRELTDDMLVIADASRPIALAGIMGGNESEIADTTTRIVLESATFDGKSIRRTTRAIRLNTEASKRFDKGLDADLAGQAADRAAALLSELADAQAVGPLVDVREPSAAAHHIRFRSSDITRLIGHTYPDEQVDSILGRLGFTLQKDGDLIDAVAPTWRHDVEGKADIAEEVARIVGYDAIPTQLPAGHLPSTHEDPRIRWEGVVRNALAAAGLQEVITYSLVDPLGSSRLNASSAYPDAPVDEDTIPIANPQSIERSRLRRTLLPSLLATVSSNLRHEPRVAIFEIAHVFLPPLNPLPNEVRRLTITVVGRRSAADWNATPDEMDFFDLKAVVEAAFAALHVPLEMVQFAGEPWQHPGQAAAITIQGLDEPIGFIGQVHPTVAARFDVENARIFAAEIMLDELLARAKDELTIRSIPRYPAITRDLAFLVDRSITHERAAATIQAAAGGLLEKLTLFDVYDGQGVPEGQVSLAYSMIFRAPDRTLEDQEVNAVMAIIEGRVTTELGTHIRGR